MKWSSASQISLADYLLEENELYITNRGRLEQNPVLPS